MVRSLLLGMLMVMSFLTLAACQDGGEPIPTPSPTAVPTATALATPTATPSPTPAGETGSTEGFRAFAVQIEAALAEEDLLFFIRRARLTEVTCPPQPHMVAACEDEPPGTVVQTFQVRNPFEGNVVTLAFYLAGLEEWFALARTDLGDEYGSGVPTLYALAHSTPGGGIEEAHAVVTAIVDGPGGQPPRREIRVFSWQFLDGIWQLIYDLSLSGISDPAFSSEVVAGWLSGDCAECYDTWERWTGGGS